MTTTSTTLILPEGKTTRISPAVDLRCRPAAAEGGGSSAPWTMHKRHGRRPGARRKPQYDGATGSSSRRSCRPSHGPERRRHSLHKYDFVPFAVESYGRLGASAQSFLKELGEVAAARGSISKAAFVKSAFREVSCALQRGLGLQYGRALFNVARASGRQFMPGLDTPVQEEGLV